MDVGLAQWARELPDIDSSAKAVTGRILRLHDVILKSFNKSFKAHGLKYPNYAVLATLRSSGHPYEMTPTALQDMMVLTSGGLSKLLARIEADGQIVRTIGSSDRRSVIVRLTDRGQTLIEQAMRTQARVEHDLIATLAPEERELLSSMLRRLLLTNGGRMVGY